MKMQQGEINILGNRR